MDDSALPAQLLALQRRNAAVADENQRLRERLLALDRLPPSRPWARLLAGVGRALVGTVAASSAVASSAVAAPSSDGSVDELRFARSLSARAADRVQIGLSAFGGMGDAVWSTAVVEAIKRKYPRSDLHVFVFERGHRDIFDGNPYVAGAYVVERALAFGRWPRLMKARLRSGALDLWFENRYAIKVHHGARSPTDAVERRALERAFAQQHVNFESWPLGNNLLSLHARRHQAGLLELTARSAVLPLPLNDPQLFIFPSEADAAILPAIDALGDFVTVHHGCDTYYVGEQLQTKNWFTERWETVIAELAARGLPVVQLGTANEMRLRGARHDFLGATSAQQTALILRHARLHMDTEGGLVHLARATHTPAVVLFGPTPLDFFGYGQNLNYRSGDCHDCWWTTEDWQARCPRGLSTPACMDAIAPAAVVHEVDRMLRRTGHRQAQVAVAEVAVLDDSTTAFADWALARVDAATVLELANGLGVLSRHLAARQQRAFVCALPPWPDAATTCGEMPHRYGSRYSLPYESDAFAAVICSAADDFEPHALAERLRLIAPGGLLVSSIAVANRTAATALVEALSGARLSAAALAAAVRAQLAPDATAAATRVGITLQKLLSEQVGVG